MKFIIVFILLALAGCSTVNTTINLSGNENTIDTQGKVISPKEISTAGSAYGDAASKGEK